MNLTATNYFLFQAFLNPNHFDRLQSMDPTLWGIGLIEHELPVGILLADVDHAFKTATITQVVANDAPHVVEKLFDHAESHFHAEGISITKITITMKGEGDQIVHLFSNKGWRKNPQILNKYIVDLKKMKQSDWVHTLKKPDNLSIVPWNSRVNEIFQNAVRQTKHLDESVLPFVRNLGVIAEDYSFALFDEEELMGWCLCGQVAQNMLLSPHSYVKRTATTRPGGMLLYAELVKKAIKDNMYVTFFANVDNHSMQNVINRRFKESVIQKNTMIEFVRT